MTRLASKMGDLDALVLEEHIGVPEANLDSSHYWDVNLYGFALFRRHRANWNGGGVCGYVRSDMKMSVQGAIVEEDCEDAETLWGNYKGR